MEEFPGLTSPFKPETLDTRLREKIRAELPAVFRWMLDGAVAYLAELDRHGRGLPAREQPPRVVREATDDYFDDEDVFGAFLDERVEIDRDRPDWRIRAITLYEAYRTYAADQGSTREIALRAMGERLAGFSVPKQRLKTGVHYCGARLR